MAQLKKEHLQNFLNVIQREGGLSNLTIHEADIRTGERVALVRKSSEGSISPKTDYLPYKQMNQLLRGYYMRMNEENDKTES